MRHSQRLSLAAGAAAALLTFATAAEARSWSRSGSVTGPRGGVTTYSAAGSCAAGQCSRSAAMTGPGGGNLTRSGTAPRTAPGQWQGTRVTTGPGGRSVTRSGSIRWQ